MPKKFEVWFLSTSATNNLETFLHPSILFSKKIAQTHLQCQRMGDYCFDPQVGLYKQGEEGKLEEEIDYREITEKENFKQIDPASSLDRQFINCETKSPYFDIFCGEQKKNEQAQGKHKLEVWIDISSTMRQVDFNGHDQSCDRELFVKRIDSTCELNKNFKLYVFDESLKQADTMSRVCTNYGTNNRKKIIERIKLSQVPNLIVITDVFEADRELIDFIDSTGVGSYKGVEERISIDYLKKNIERIAKLCK